MCAQRSRHEVRKHRHWKMRHKIKGTASRPRLAVFKSLNHIYAQVIDDTSNSTIVAASSVEKDNKEIKTGCKKEIAAKVGQLLADRAREKGVETVVFDRGGFRYHGRIKELADAARKGGLQF